MFVLFAALISSVSFAQTKIPITAGFPGCIQTTKTFTITDADSAFKKISFITSKEMGKLVKIESAPPNEPLLLRCDLFNKKETQSKQWAVNELDSPLSLQDILLEFVDQEKGNEKNLGTYVITNKNEDIVHSKVIVHQLGTIQLHDDRWPKGKFIQLACGFDSSIQAQSTRLEIYEKEKLKAKYETIQFDNLPPDPDAPPKKGPCPAEDYTVSVERENFLRISSAEKTPTSDKKSSGVK